MVTWKIPYKSFYFPVTRIFSAQFNVPTVGKYDFNIAANQKLEFFKIYDDKIYLIDRVFINADIGSDVYNFSISTAPELQFYLGVSDQFLLKYPYSIMETEQQNIGLFLYTDQRSDRFLVTMRGVFNQVAETIGQNIIRLFVTLGVFEITDTNFVSRFRSSSLDDKYNWVRN